MNLLKLSFRNLLRYRRRTLITASALAYGVLMFIFFDSFMSGANAETFRNLKVHDYGDGQILASGWWEQKEELSLDFMIENPSKIEKLLQGIPHTAHIDFTAELLFYKEDGYVEDGDLPVQVKGIDPETVQDVFEQYDAIIEGEMLKSDDDGILLGSWFSDKLGAKTGAPLLLQVKTKYGSTDVIEVEVSGIIHSPDMTLNRKAVYIPRTLADEYLELDGAVTGFTFLGNEKKMEAIQEKLGPEAEFLSFNDLSYSFQSMAAMSDDFIVVFIFLILIIAAVGVSNTMMMGVYERKYEIGMLRSMGMNEKQILQSFVLEAMGIGITGVIIGLFLAIPLNIFLVEIGIDYSFMFKDFDVGYRTTGVLHGAWKARPFILSISSGILLSGIMALIPARRVLKKSIPENLRTRS